MNRAGRPSKIRYRELFRDREFTALFVADVVSRTGSHLGRFALAALVYQSTGSLTATSATFAITYLPGILAGPILSTLADRLPRKPLLIACDLSRAALIAGIAFTAIPVWVSLGLLLCVELVKIPFGAARMALLSDILDGERFAAGNALVGASQQVVQVIGFGLGGLLVTGLGSRTALVLDTASYLFSAALLATMLRPRPAAHSGDSGKRLHPLRDTAVGFRVVWCTGRLPTLFWLLFLGPTVLATAEGLAIPYATLLGSGQSAGLLLLATPLGTVLGLGLVGKLSPRSRERILIPFCLAVGCSVTVAGLIQAVPAVALSLFAAGVAMGHIAHLQASIVSLVTSDVRGRVIGLANTALAIGQGLAALLAGVVAEQTSIPLVLAWSGGIAMAAVLVVVCFGAPYAGRHRADTRALRRGRRAERRRVRTAIQDAPVRPTTPPVPTGPGFVADARQPGPTTARSRPQPWPAGCTAPLNPPTAGRLATSLTAQRHAPARSAGSSTSVEGRPADPLARPGAPRVLRPPRRPTTVTPEMLADHQARHYPA